ncbi:MAG TPA: FHA domain-containing serine/threonine-protein kinase [Candidatus Brocadiia bacterium]|nr:FHA domain-containing serine/threonine-protein kinase [Candidatus Brocadiia bacterium]
MIATMVIRAGKGVGQEFEIPEGKPSWIGRDPFCVVRLRDPEISRRHCELHNDRDKVIIKDLGSRNGTLVNSRRLRDTIELKDRDIIQIGGTQLQVKVSEPAQPAEEPETPQQVTRGSVLKPVATVLRRPTTAAEEGSRFSEHPPVIGDVPEIGEDDPLIGKSVSDFTLLAKIGTGPIATVYKARDIKRDRLVAIKLVRPGVEFSDVARSRFVRGAKTWSAVIHPNVVRILGGGIYHSLYYVVMEYVDGISLEKMIETMDTGYLPYRKVAEIGLQVAQGLEVAFEKNVVHRNIKPSNVIISKSGMAFLADFGLAKSVEGAGDSDITTVASVLAAPHYLAPEQLSNPQVADHRCDIYGLGATMYCAATGRTPYAGLSGIDLVVAITWNKLDPVHDMVFDAPKEFSDFVARAMALKPEERFQTPQELIEALREFL